MLVIDHFLRVRCCSKHFTERLSLKHIPLKHELLPVLSVPPRWAQDTSKSQASG